MTTNSKIIYIDLKQALELHNWIIDNSGGTGKIENEDCFNNILQQIQRNRDYPELEHKLTQLVFGINKSEPEIQDSERLSIALGCFLLELNGYDYVVHYFAEEMENIVIWIKQDKVNRELLAEIINSLIYEEDYSEELKLKIVNCIS